MKIKLILVSITLVLAGSLIALFFYQRQPGMRSVQVGEVPVLTDDPATIERVTIEEGPEVTEKITREVLRPTDQLESIWGELYQPWGLKIVNDLMYILDRGNNRVVVCDLQGRFIRQIGGVGQGPGEFIWPWSFAVSQTGEVYVLTNDAPQINTIHIFDRLGQFVQKIQLDFLPQSLAVNSKREIFLSAPDEQAIIRVYSTDGQLLRKFGSPQLLAEAGGNMILLSAYNDGHLYLNKEDELYIAFISSSLVRIYGSDGKLLRQIKVRGREIDQLIRIHAEAGERPHLTAGGEGVSRAYLFHDLAVDARGNIWLALADRYLYIYGQRGDLQRVMHLAEDAKGLIAMHHLAFDYQDALYGLNLLKGLYVFLRSN